MSLSPEELATIEGSREKFLAFLERRVPSETTAAEMLEGVLGKARERLETPQGGECAVAWVYRLLRQALSDHNQHLAAEARAHVRQVRGRAIRAARTVKVPPSV